MVRWWSWDVWLERDLATLGLYKSGPRDNNEKAPVAIVSGKGRQTVPS